MEFRGRGFKSRRPDRLRQRPDINPDVGPLFLPKMSRCWVQAFSHTGHRRVTRKAEKYASVLMSAQSAILPALEPFFRSVTTRLGCDAPLT
jgi:hypothetical protein